MLGRLESDLGNVDSSKFGSWAKKKGATVITVPRLSFQDEVDVVYHDQDHLGHRQGPWLRLEIPRLVEENSLLDIAPKICKNHVLYTDSDVIFANKISKADIHSITSEMVSSGAVVSYGREASKKPQIANTGVMFMDLKKFGALVPKIQSSSGKGSSFPALDQGLINNYLTQNQESRHLLPIHYNWKVYWKLEPSSFEEVKILHFHGPKVKTIHESIHICFATISFYEQ